MIVFNVIAWDANCLQHIPQRLGSATITTSRQYLHARNKNAMVNLPIIDGILGARRVVGEEHDSGWIDGLIGKNINGGELKNIRLKVTLQPTPAN